MHQALLPIRYLSLGLNGAFPYFYRLLTPKRTPLVLWTGGSNKTASMKVNGLLLLFLFSFGTLVAQNSLNNTKAEGYRPIWFELGQKYPDGDKYSGALGTYTAKHVPLAIYAPEVDKTFFVYGGTTRADARYLLCMIGSYDHETGEVSRPTVVHDKQGVDDPHDNPSLLVDDQGYLWVFVSGRGRTRKREPTAPHIPINPR